MKDVNQNLINFKPISMKKVMMMLAIVLATTSLFGQTKERTSAFMFNKNGQYDKAREAIDKAILNEKTMNDAKTWMYRGIIYLNIVFSDQFAGLDPQALEKSLESFQKALELDPQDKMKQAEDIIPRIDAIGQQYFAKGVDHFNAATGSGSKDEFKLAAGDFHKSFEVAQLNKKVDTLALLNAGLASLRGEHFDEALNYYTQLKGLCFNEPDLYRSLAAVYRGMHDQDKMLNALAQGRELYPNDPGLILEEINAYLSMGQGAKVVDELIKLTESDPTNYSIFFVLGTIYGDDTKPELYDLEKAVHYYKKAIELSPEYYDVIYNLGALYINESNKLQVKANDLPLTETKEYDKLTEDANVLIKEALPYLEKSNKLQPGNQETIQVLKSIYTRFKMNDELKKLEE